MRPLKYPEILATVFGEKEQTNSSGNNENTHIDTADETLQQPQPFPREIRTTVSLSEKNSMVLPLTGKSRLLFLFIIVHSITHNRLNTNFVLFFGNLKQKPQFRHQHRGHMSIEIIHIMVRNKYVHVAYNKRRE